VKCVIDASVVAAIVLPDESSPVADGIAERVAADGATGPVLLQFELANILIMAQRRRRITGAQLIQICDDLDALPIELQPALDREERGRVMGLAQKHSLSAYDAAYLELAMRLNLPLASLDTSLAKAAKAEGIKSAASA